ncbi:chlorinating enzyme [Pseudoalteromonas sp. CO348]|uniref:chlorinating enzyme n=1 Tax=unclassified Pseudoalteromonas TaxID=194690 RepID=UPI001023C251|nr:MULTISPECIES: chlorinating enzyme [unclassified Pseudoalteromonas]MCG7540027.1 chlorinating enzyme [Pseudoalteromonas sp. OF7H-1]RZG07239.1 chlorinating enzyme [Pseudoalteromonas sp. CO348]
MRRVDSNKNYRLTDEELSKFEKQGFIGPFDLYDSEEIAAEFKALRKKLFNTKEAAYANDNSISGSTNLANYDRHLDVDFLDKHIHRPEIVDRVESILGRDLLVWRTEFFPKYPGDEGTDWHQASNFSGVAGDKKPQIEWPDGSDFGGTITVWAALTDSTIENGCLQFIPETHRELKYDESKVIDYDENSINQEEKDGIKRGFFGYDYRQLQIDPNWKPDESKAESMVMKAGQFIIFWSTLMHASHPHSGKTNAMRLGYATRYLPTSVKVYPYSKGLNEFGGGASLNKHKCVLVSGEDKFGHNTF